MAARHHSTYPGRRVSVVLRNGERIQGRFVERNDRYCLIEGHKRIPWKNVRSFRTTKVLKQQKENR